jgi:hypothetical protein
MSPSPCQLLYVAADRPSIKGAADEAGWLVLPPRRRPSQPPQGQACYLTGDRIEVEGVPVQARIKKATWTAHGTAAAPDSEWLSPAAVWSLSEKATHPEVARPFKMRTMSHLVIGDRWQVLPLREKRLMAETLLLPPGEPWFLAMCEKPLAASHIIYRAPVNYPQATSWSVSLSGLIVRGSSALLSRLLRPIEALYQADHAKKRINGGEYVIKYIAAQGEAEWASLEAQIAPHRGSGLFKLALFLAQKEK